jgi:hypothetical protein
MSQDDDVEIVVGTARQEVDACGQLRRASPFLTEQAAAGRGSVVARTGPASEGNLPGGEPAACSPAGSTQLQQTIELTRRLGANLSHDRAIDRHVRARIH